MRVRLLVLLVAAAGCAREPPLRFPQAPVVLISIDTLRADRLPVYGYRGVETPAIDRFRRDAVLFRSAWSPCPMTLPSHVTMLTGRQPNDHGVRSNAGFTFRGTDSLPSRLKAHGYATGATVSSYVLRAETGLGALFDAYDDAIDPRPGAAFADYQRPGGAAVAMARRWTAERKGAPFFFLLHLYEPHVPYEPPEPFRSRYPSAYDGEVAASDALVGAVLDDLRAAGVYDRAIVVLTSDHGEGLGDHGEDQHSILLYREAIQVPLLVKLPHGRRAGETVSEPAQLADIAPTLAGLLGLPAPRGVSLFALAGAGARQLYAETLYPRLSLGWSELRSLVDARWHYIHGLKPELYDLLADPGETRDLAATQPAVAGAMRRALEAQPLLLPSPEAVPRETAERLAALGYAAGGGSRPRGALLDPRDGLPYLVRLREALALAAQERYEPALAGLRAIVAERPDMAEAWVQMADVLGRAGRFGEAVEAYGAALRHGHASADLWLARGMAALSAGRLDGAEADARRAEAQLPVTARELRARVALARGQAEKARDFARAAVQAKSPPAPSALLTLAEVLARSGDGGGALATLAEAEKAAMALGLPRPFGLDFWRGDTLARLDRPVEAEAAYRREVAGHPGNTRAWANLAVLLFLQRRAAEIDPLLEEMVRRHPGHAAYRTAAATWAALGDSRRAAAWRARQPSD